MSHSSFCCSSSSNHYCALLKLTCETRNPANAKKLHCHIVKSFRSPETFLLNNLIISYAKLGSITYARRVFDQMPHPKLYSWNSILSTYSKLGHLPEMEHVLDASGSLVQFDELGLDILSIALPAAVALAADPIASLIDTAFVGHIGAVELAAVGVSASVFNQVSKAFNVSKEEDFSQTEYVFSRMVSQFQSRMSTFPEHGCRFS